MPVLKLIAITLVIIISAWFLNHNVLKVEHAVHDYGTEAR